MAHLQVQPSINDARSAALLDLIERLGALDLTPLLVYRIDSAPDSVLLALAWQFDMLAPQWQLGANTAESVDAITNIDALTDIDTLSSTDSVAGTSDYDSLRTLLKAAIPLHRTRGTPYSIKTALKSLGWNATLLEGQSSWGGAGWPAAEGWAVFRVRLDLAPGQAVTASDAGRAIAAINFFKNARSLMDSLWFAAAGITDTVAPPADFIVSIFSQHDAAPAPADAVSAPAWTIADSASLAPLYDGRFAHGGIRYGAAQPPVADEGVVLNGAAIAPGY
jgi:P2-related tail formation protein